MTLTVTNSGLAASLDAAEKGIKLKIKKIGFGSAGYVPNKDQTSLKSEFLRTPFTDSSISSNALNVNIVFDDLNQSFDAREIGYYLEDETLFAVDSLDGAIISSKHKGSILTESFEIVLSDHLIDSITVDVVGVSRATENNVGIAKIATSNEVGDANNDADIVTPKKMLMILGDRGISGSGCLDAVSLNSDDRGSILFSDERSSITINSAKYLFSSSVVEIDTSEILLEKLVGNVSRKDFVYVTSEGDLLLSKGTDDSSDPKIAFSKIGFAPVSGDPLLYKKGEIYALAIGFIQRVGDTYFSSKLPSAAPKIEPKLIDCWFDLRLSAHEQDVNLLREKAIRAAVAAELRGKSKVPFTTFGFVDGVSWGGSNVSNSLFQYNGAAADFYGIGWRFCTPIIMLNVASGAVGYGIISSANGHVKLKSNASNLGVDSNDRAFTDTFFKTGISYIARVDMLTAEFDTVPWVDIIGTPKSIAETFPNGVLGQWIPKLPTGSIETFNFNRKKIKFIQYLYKSSPSSAWHTDSSDVIDDITNSRDLPKSAESVSLYIYETLSDFTEKSNNSIVRGAIGDVYVSSNMGIYFGGRLAQSTVDVITKGAAGSHYVLGSHLLTYYLMTSGHTIHTPVSLLPKHSAIGAGNQNDSHGVKALSTITEKNGLLYLQLHGCELIHNGTNWGDDSTVPIISGEGTKADKNGNTVKTFCHHSIFPIGIADSQTLASLKIDNRANISDDINSGLHFDCLEDVPSPIRDFYYEIEDDLGLIRVYKHPHPHENGGHISDESVASWQFHDDFKNWLQTCAEIKFNAAQAGEESERVPLPPMPLKSDYVGEKQ